MVELSRRVAIVTGASRGLGAVCCRHLAREGMHVALVARTAAALEREASALREQGADALAVPADISDPGQVEAMLRTVEEQMGPPYLLVNAMNIESLQGSPFEHSTLEQWEKVMGAKPRGFYLTMRAVAPGMLARGEGCILNVASGSGVSGSPGHALFTAGEFAIVGMTDALAREVQDRGVHAAALCPWGIIDSERVRRAMPERDPEEFMAEDELAETIVYLAKRSRRGWVRRIIVRAPSAVE